MRIKYANPIRTGATLCNGSPNKAWLCFGIVCILLMKSWGPERGRGRVQWVSAPEFKPISGPLGSDGLSSHWQPLVGAITQASTTTSMDIPSHELQLFLSPPKSSWSDSQHMDNIQPSMKAGRRKPMTMNKCSGKPPVIPRRSWGEANSPRAHASLSGKMVSAGSGEEGEQDVGSVIPETGFEAESQGQPALGTGLTFLRAGGSGEREEGTSRRKAPLLEPVVRSRSWSGLSSDHTDSSILHTPPLASCSYLPASQEALLASLPFLPANPSTLISADRELIASYLPHPSLWRRKPAAGRAQPSANDVYPPPAREDPKNPGLLTGGRVGPQWVAKSVSLVKNRQERKGSNLKWSGHFGDRWQGVLEDFGTKSIR